MASTAAAPNLNLRLKISPHHRHSHIYGSNNSKVMAAVVVGRSRPTWTALPPPVLALRPRRRSASLLLLTRAAGDDDSSAAAPEESALSKPRTAVPPDIEAFSRSAVGPGDGYISLFVRMLGLDNDPLDREHAVITLWKYSQGGKHCIDTIMQFPGCVNLVVNLLKSDSSSTCEAAAGLLRTISSVNMHRDSVAESGAIEEIGGLLCRTNLTAEVKEESLCTLWNLSIDEGLRGKIARSDLLPALIKFLDDEEIKVKEAAGGVLANLALSRSNHGIMVEAGVIPKLAELLKSNAEGHKIIRKEAKNALLELSKDEYHKILIIEEGLVLVPIIGAAAYKSLRHVSHSWPSLPDGTEIERTSGPSRYGASELLLGLNIHEKSFNLEEAKMHAIVGRSQQQFLARIGAIEIEGRISQLESFANERQTILPWMDGVARLVLILGLEDVSAITRAAHAIADASINEHMRIAFKEAGAVRLLVQLLVHNDEAVREAVIHGLERLSISYEVCQIIEAERVLDPLINILKKTDASESHKEKIVNILARIYDPGKEMKTKFHDKLVNESEKVMNTSYSEEVGGLAETPDMFSVPEMTVRAKVIDSGIISCLVEILKASSPNLQKKAASILEYLAHFEEQLAAITAAGIESGLAAVFQPSFLDGMEDVDYMQELNVIEAEENGLAIAAASRLLTKLLNFEHFRRSIDSMHFITLLRKILRSGIPLHTKDWVAACLVKIESLVGSDTDLEYPIDMEVALYEAIPRLVEQMRTSFSSESREATVVELNAIISKGVAECSKAVAAAGGVFPLVQLIEEGGSGSAVEASLAILYNLSMDSENHSAIVAAGAVPVLRRMVLSEGPHWTRALHLLRTLPT